MVIRYNEPLSKCTGKEVLRMLLVISLTCSDQMCHVRGSKSKNKTYEFNFWM